MTTITKKIIDLDIKQRADVCSAIEQALNVLKENNGKRIDKRLADKIQAVNPCLYLRKTKNWHNENEWSLTFYPKERAVSDEPDKNGVCHTYYTQETCYDLVFNFKADFVDFEKWKEILEKRSENIKKTAKDLRFCYENREKIKKEREELVKMAEDFRKKYSYYALKYLDICTDTLWR